MVKIWRMYFIISVLSLLPAGLAWADSGPHFLNSPHGKLTGTTGNGFPRGKFYKLQVIGKDDRCPIAATQGGPLNSKVVYIPSNGESLILIQSGSGANPDVTTIQVTDQCSEFDGTPAVVQLPANELGYRVFMRIIAKPGGDINITSELVSAEDEVGSDLVSLGLVTDDGFLDPSFSLSRGQSKKSGNPGSNGDRPIAVNVTDLFAWNGTTCNFSSASCNSIGPCTEVSYCCTDINSVYDSCVVNEGSCIGGSSEVTAYCQSFADAPVFSVGDFVTYGWQIDNNGIYNFEVRFYPVTE